MLAVLITRTLFSFVFSSVTWYSRYLCGVSSMGNRQLFLDKRNSYLLKNYDGAIELFDKKVKIMPFIISLQSFQVVDFKYVSHKNKNLKYSTMGDLCQKLFQHDSNINLLVCRCSNWRFTIWDNYVQIRNFTIRNIKHCSFCQLNCFPTASITCCIYSSLIIKITLYLKFRNMHLTRAHNNVLKYCIFAQQSKYKVIVLQPNL